MTKSRPPVPDPVVAELEFRSDRRCCVCHIPRLAHQIHHIDGDPSNNHLDNLAILCLQHHAEAEVTGGIGRKLSAAQIRKYRSEWYAVVESQRPSAASAARPPQGHDAQSTLRRLIRSGIELQNEALLAGNAAERTLGRPSTQDRLAEFANYRQREEVWTALVEDALAGSPAADQFMNVQGLPSTEFYAIHNRLDARVKFLREVLGATHSTERSPEDRLASAIEAGMRLRTGLVLADDELPPLGDDPLYQWARDAHQVLLRDGVLEADAFYGEDPMLGPAYLGLAFVSASKELGRQRYLETRLDVLKAALGRRQPPSTPRA